MAGISAHIGYVSELSFTGLLWTEIFIKNNFNYIMRYAWVSLAVAALWISAIMLILSGRLAHPNNFYIFVVTTTVIVSYIGFRSA